ncbi:hypothetical protein HAX54_006860 [Datura stramonium]|uniref:Uncharacterized protein n=1 Tax=Datura stramonium TaxID=4076 RepID=A0ABS8WUD9_DATST|nr:hypothetical protein [Datura stramonium]
MVVVGDLCSLGSEAATTVGLDAAVVARGGETEVGWCLAGGERLDLAVVAGSSSERSEVGAAVWRWVHRWCSGEGRREWRAGGFGYGGTQRRWRFCPVALMVVFHRHSGVRDDRRWRRHGCCLAGAVMAKEEEDDVVGLAAARG